MTGISSLVLLTIFKEESDALPSLKGPLHNPSLRGALATKQSRDSGSTPAGHEGKGGTPQPRLAARDDVFGWFKGNFYEDSLLMQSSPP